jgi:Arc/MetJ-type ribon-helix-helix transcriptional regulator
MQAQVSPKWEAFVETSLASGEFETIDEIVNAALEHMAEARSDLELCHRDVGPRLSMSEFRDLIEEGIADADAGRVGPLDIEDIKRRGRERLTVREASVER